MNRQKCILVVADDATDFFLLRRGFEEAGLTDKLVHVMSVEEALDYLAGLSPFSDRAKHPVPDLLLLEPRMPRTDGFDLLRQLQSQPGLSALPVVVLSSSVRKADAQKAKELGAREFMRKPKDINASREIVLELHQRWLRDTAPPAPDKP